MRQSATIATPRIAVPIIVTAEMGKADQAWMNGLRQRHFPPERNQLDAHTTLFHHLPPSLQSELQTLLRRFTGGPKPAATIEGAYSLGTGVAIGLRSADLLEIWSQFAERFDRHLTPQDQHPPRLHATVQNKVTPAVAKATLAELAMIVIPRPIEITALASWHYRGGPWSLIGRHAFRG